MTQFIFYKLILCVIGMVLGFLFFFKFKSQKSPPLEIEHYNALCKIQHQQWKDRTTMKLNTMIASGNVTGYWGFSENDAVTGCLWLKE